MAIRLEPYQKHIPSQGTAKGKVMTVKNFNGTSAAKVVRTEMGVQLVLESKSLITDKTTQVSGWFELPALEQLIAELQQVASAVRKGE